MFSPVNISSSGVHHHCHFFRGAFLGEPSWNVVFPGALPDLTGRYRVLSVDQKCPVGVQSKLTVSQWESQRPWRKTALLKATQRPETPSRSQLFLDSSAQEGGAPTPKNEQGKNVCFLHNLVIMKSSSCFGIPDMFSLTAGLWEQERELDQPGLGFPPCRLIALFHLATGKDMCALWRYPVQMWWFSVQDHIPRSKTYF